MLRLMFPSAAVAAFLAQAGPPEAVVSGTPSPFARFSFDGDPWGGRGLDQPLVQQAEPPGVSPLGRSLLAVNVVLLSALFIFQLESPARGGAVDPRPRGSYLMVTSTMEAGNSEVLYLIDDANREMVALRWDQVSQAFIGLGYRDIDRDTKQLAPKASEVTR